MEANGVNWGGWSEGVKWVGESSLDFVFQFPFPDYIHVFEKNDVENAA